MRVEKYIDLRYTLRYLGVGSIGSSSMFGDNESLDLISMSFTTKLYKRHNTLQFHRIKESVAAGICRLHYLLENLNPADARSNHWSYSDVW